MKTRIEVTPLEPGRFGVPASGGTVTTHHKVAVHSVLLDAFGLIGMEHDAVVYETFAIVLEREPLTEVPAAFPLENVADRYPGLVGRAARPVRGVALVAVAPLASDDRGHRWKSEDSSLNEQNEPPEPSPLRIACSIPTLGGDATLLRPQRTEGVVVFATTYDLVKVERLKLGPATLMARKPNPRSPGRRTRHRRCES
jgi:hypothetical protein